MEIDVVDQEQLPLGERREEAGDLVGERGEMIGRGAFGGEAGRADLEDTPRLVDIVDGDLVERGS